MNKENTVKTTEKNNLRTTIKELFIAILIALVISFFCPIGAISGESMEPTMSSGSIVLKNMFATEYEVGDIVVAKLPGSIFTNIIKRVVAVPGDTVLSCSNGDLYVNGELLVLEGVELGSTATLSPEMEITLGDNEYFICGDNRQYSYDSRSFGAISGDDITAKVIHVFNFNI